MSFLGADQGREKVSKMLSRTDLSLLLPERSEAGAQAGMCEVTEFERRFRNWVRWCVQKGLHQGRTGSAEGAYRSPQHWDPVGPRPPAIDVLDAVVVNRAYTRLAQLAPSQANIIKVLTFQNYIKPQRQAQILGTHYLRLGILLDNAKIMLRNQLHTA